MSAVDRGMGLGLGGGGGGGDRRVGGRRWELGCGV